MPEGEPDIRNPDEQNPDEQNPDEGGDSAVTVVPILFVLAIVTAAYGGILNPLSETGGKA